MPNRSILLASLVVCLALASACGHAHIPAAANIPMMDRKGDIHLNPQGGTQGAQGNAAYGLGDHIQLRGSIQNSQTLQAPEGFHRMLSGGLGYYLALSSRTSGSGIRIGGALDLGGGLVKGKETLDGDTGRTFSGYYFRSAAQADGGVEFSSFALGGAVRLVYIHMEHDDDSDATDPRADQVNAEPFVMFRVGGERLKFDTQVGVSFPLTGTGEIGTPLPVILSFGVTADF